MITVKAGWNMKAPPGPYESIGTWAEVQVELDDKLWEPEQRGKLMAEMKIIQDTTRASVEAELAAAIKRAKDIASIAQEQGEARDTKRRTDEERQLRETGRRPEPEPEPERPRRADPEPQRERPRERDDRGQRPRWGGGYQSNGNRGGDRGRATKDWTKTRDIPRTGNELYGYAKDFKSLPWFSEYADSNNLPSRIADWTKRDVADALRAFEDTPVEETNGAAY
jgi:hypothetical protein